MKSKLEIYALSVCFASVVCLIINAGIGGYAIFEIAAPEITMSSYEYDKHQSNDAFWNKVKISCSKSEKEEAQPSEEELTKRRQASFEIAIKSEKREGFQSLLHSIIYLIVAGLALFIHSKIAKNSQAQSA
jgi:hypothetical protein